MSTLDRSSVEESDIDEFAYREPSDRRRGIFYILAGLIGLLGSFVITVDKIKLLEDPSFVPSCSINPIISCGTIMKSAQSHAFGFPNPLIGLMGFAVVVTLGVLMVAGVKLPRWTWWGIVAGTGAGLSFVAWLISQALYSIGALCPWCMGVWAVMIPLFTVSLARALRTGGQRSHSVAGYVPILAVIAYATVILLVFVRFQSFWVSLF